MNTGSLSTIQIEDGNGSFLVINESDFDASLHRRYRPATTFSPTFEMFIAAGYAPEAYPPSGYVEVDSEGLRAYRASLGAPPPSVFDGYTSVTAADTADAQADAPDDAVVVDASLPVPAPVVAPPLALAPPVPFDPPVVLDGKARAERVFEGTSDAPLEPTSTPSVSALDAAIGRRRGGARS